MKTNTGIHSNIKQNNRINQISLRQQRCQMNTFKAGSDLRKQLNKIKAIDKNIKINDNMVFNRESKKNQQRIAKQEVAALDHFNLPVSREKTKNIIQNIKLRRREKHIDTLSRFKEDVQEYKQNLLSVYDSLINDTDQVMVIKLTEIEEYLKSCNNKQFLLSRQKQILNEIQQKVINYKIQCETKIGFAKQQLNRIQADRQQMAGQLCKQLSMAIIQIAFILEPQAIQIQNKQRNSIKIMETQKFKEFSDKMDIIVHQQNSKFQYIVKLSTQVKSNWKTLKQQLQLQSFTKQSNQDPLRRPYFLRQLFNKLMNIQAQNHQQKLKLLNNLMQQNPDTLNKINIGKISTTLKKINQIFDGKLDLIMVEFKNANNSNKDNNKIRLDKCKQRLLYIQKHNEQETQKIIQQKCMPLYNRNVDQQQRLIKQATTSTQNQDDKQTKVIQKMIAFINKIGQQNDNYIKQFGVLNQKYELQKAKILDDDEQIVEKQKQQLQKLKIQLKQSLHHIKLQQIQKKCFDKIDEIQKIYRLCHQKNKLLKQTRLPLLQQFFKKYQAKIAQILYLYHPSRKIQLQDKNKKQLQDIALKRIQIENKKKLEEEEKKIAQQQQTKTKGGKVPPPPKPKDPKKVAAQLEERKKAILAQLGTRKIQQIKTNTGSTWLVFKSIKEICQEFYRATIKQLNQGKQQNKSVLQLQQSKKPVDASEQQLLDCRNMSVTNTKSFITLTTIVPMLQKFREKIFISISQKKSRIINESSLIDEQMLQISLINLDNRLKQHYSLKGRIQNEIYVKRSGEIKNHKKKYEKYIRIIKQKIDLQTQKYNYLLQKSIELLKNYINNYKNIKDNINKCKNLSELQGLSNKNKQSFNHFNLNTKQIYNQLQRLSNIQVQNLIKKNQQFIQQSKLMKDGGQYSSQQIAWYQKMINQITTQMKQQQQKRQQKLKQLKQHSDKKKQQLLDNFDKQYTIAIEQSAAKDGTGKKYGKPKRVAQEKMRLEMSKCQQSQININKMIQDISKQFQNQSKNEFKHQNYPTFILWRQKLMSLQFCIMRYIKHIQALKPDIKISTMIRVTYNLKVPDTKLLAEQQQQDKKRRVQEIKLLGTLSQQKDERVFVKYCQDIQKIISDQSRSIYVGDKAKYLTGSDKIPDFLRVYIVGMRKSAQIFRVSCVRELRQSCGKLADLAANISQMFFSAMLSYYGYKQKQYRNSTLTKLTQYSSNHKTKRIQNMHKLRPNLQNPKCQQQLKQLDELQKKRNEQNKKYGIDILQQFKNNMFKNAEEFISCLINHYQFLLFITDAFYLYQDFIKLPGDQNQDKIHLDVQKLMIMKQKGIKIDPSSQRNIKKKWQGVDFTIFDIQSRKYIYKKVEQPPKQKDKKGSKKQTKSSKKQQQNIPQVPITRSQVLQTYKTWRQKSVFENRERVKLIFKQQYDKILKQITIKIQNENKENLLHEKKWRQIADSLYLK